MALQLAASLGQMRLSCSHQPRPVASSAKLGGFCSTMRGQQLIASRPATVARASVFQVEAKQNSLQRIKTSEKARERNKARRSAIRTRMKKVFVALEGLKSALPSSEDAVKPVETLISEAYVEIDKAVAKGVMHANTGARRKQRMALAKRSLLVEAGLYTPQ